MSLNLAIREAIKRIVAVFVLPKAAPVADSGAGQLYAWDFDRHFHNHEEYLRWRAVEIKKISQLVDADDLLPWLSHRSGYAREAALVRVAELRITVLWDEVFERCNDWVSGIRFRAKEVALEWLKETDIAVFFAHLPALDKLRLSRREDHADFVGKFDVWLAQEANWPWLLRGAQSVSSPRLARYCFSLLQRSGFPLERLISLGLKSSDVVTRGAVLELVRGMPVEAQLRHALSLLASGRNYLKWYGLDILSRADADRGRELALDYLLSPYAALREKARRLSGLSQAELISLAERRLSSPPASSSEIVICLNFLGLSGLDVHQSIAQSFLTHFSPRVRGAALLALARLAPEQARPLVLPWVVSEFASEGRAAVIVAHMLGLTPSQEQWPLLAGCCASDSSAQRLVAWARSYGKWQELGVLLEISSIYPQHHAFCGAALRNWQVCFNRSWAELDGAYRNWITSKLDVAQELDFNPQQLRFYMG